MIIKSNSWIQAVKPHSGFTLGKKLMVLSENHVGWEVQEYTKDRGWINTLTEPASNGSGVKPLVLQERGLAMLVLEETIASNKGNGREFQIRESMDASWKREKKNVNYFYG